MKNKTTDFAKHLTSFLTSYLSEQKGRRPNTIESYAQAFHLLLTFFSKKENFNISKLKIADITSQKVLDFLSWLENEKHSKPQTRNLRLSAIRNFFRYVAKKEPTQLLRCQEILSIEPKSCKDPIPVFLSVEGMKLLFEQPNLRKAKGRRDLALLAMMYDAGLRVQEAIDVTPSSIAIKKHISIRVIGKGEKTREVVLINASFDHVRLYMREQGLDDPKNRFHPLYYNHRREKLSRQGVNGILKKYVDMAKKVNSSLIPDGISCHSLRHSKAMHLLDAGVSLLKISHLLGHASVMTTQIYARVSMEQMRAALERGPKVVKDAAVESQPRQDNEDHELLMFLSSLRGSASNSKK